MKITDRSHAPTPPRQTEIPRVKAPPPASEKTGNVDKAPKNVGRNVDVEA